MTFPNWYWNLSSRWTPRWEIFSSLVTAGEQGWMREGGEAGGKPSPEWGGESGERREAAGLRPVLSPLWSLPRGQPWLVRRCCRHPSSSFFPASMRLAE